VGAESGKAQGRVVADSGVGTRHKAHSVCHRPLPLALAIILFHLCKCQRVAINLILLTQTVLKQV
jgi:hypothetical protein